MEDMKGKIRVYARSRPMLKFELDKGQKRESRSPPACLPALPRSLQLPCWAAACARRSTSPCTLTAHQLTARGALLPALSAANPRSRAAHPRRADLRADVEGQEAGVQL